MLTIKRSPIHGLGVFATENISEGTSISVITYPHLDSENSFFYLTDIGKRINHSYTHNARMEKKFQGGSVTHLVVANRDIMTDEEITLNYNTLQPDFGPAESWYK